MTQADIIRALRKQMSDVRSAILKVAENHPSHKEKFVDGKFVQNTHLSFEECMDVYKELNANELQIIYLQENYKKGYTDYYEITGTHKFLEKFEKDPNIKCCNTCCFCVGKTNETNKVPQPFCEVYNKYLKTLEANVYEDWCSSYLRAKLPKPRQWFRKHAPINLNMYGETDTINGIENSRMMNSERSVKDAVVRVNQVGFDDGINGIR